MLRNDKKWTIYRIFFVAICLQSAFHPCWTLNTEEYLNFETRVSMSWMAGWRPHIILSNLHQIAFLFTTFAHLILSLWETNKRNVRFLSDSVWEDFKVFLCYNVTSKNVWHIDFVILCRSKYKRNIFVAKHVPIIFIDNFEGYIGFNRKGKKKYIYFLCIVEVHGNIAVLIL